MYNDKKILALIPARGGSKGIKNKNIINLCGKPLISYSIESCKKCDYIDRIVVSTDSDAIAEVALRYGADVPFKRPNNLAADTSKTIDAVLHAIDFFNSQGERYDVLLLIQPTQPLRTSGDITSALEKYFRDEVDLVSVCEVEDNPVLIRTIEDNKLKKMLSVNSTCRRQDFPVYYKVNGCIYINSIDNLSVETSFNDNPGYFIMERSHSIDIDEPMDLLVAEAIVQI